MARRSNARQAKIALRKAALAEDLKPVRAGESGGQYKPLTESDIEQIDATVYRILEEVALPTPIRTASKPVSPSVQPTAKTSACAFHARWSRTHSTSASAN